MILESLIEDAMTLTFDCAKAKIARGDTIEIDDKHWRSNEIQGAIKQGFVRLVGSPPKLPEEKPEQRIEDEPTKAYVNVSPTKIAFEIMTGKNDDVGEPIRWKEYAEPNGGVLNVPLSLIHDKQIRNALGWGLLIDPSGQKKSSKNAPVSIEELTEEDLKNMATRPGRQKRKSSKAKAITSVATESGDEESGEFDLFKPSEVIEPEPFESKDEIDVESLISSAPQDASEVEGASENEAEVEAEEEVDGFMEIFGVEPVSESEEDEDPDAEEF